MIDMFDVDKTKEISFEEFQQLWAYLGNLRQAFDKFDVDKGGAIDAQELTEGILLKFKNFIKSLKSSLN